MPDEFTWTDASARYQAKNGTAGERKTESAWMYIEDRMDGYTIEQANLNVNAAAEDLLLEDNPQPEDKDPWH